MRNYTSRARRGHSLNLKVNSKNMARKELRLLKAIGAKVDSTEKIPQGLMRRSKITESRPWWTMAQMKTQQLHACRWIPCRTTRTTHHVQSLQTPAQSPQ
eukprot:g13389.t1